MLKKVEKNNKKRRNQKSKISWKRMVYYFFCLVFLVLVFYVFIYSRLVKISNIEILERENKKVDDSDVYNEIQSKIQEKNWLKIDKDNFFLVSENNLKENILTNFPKIKDVEIKKIFPNKMKINLIEYDLMPIICLKSQNDDCFVLDNEGKIVEKADFNNPKLKENEKVIIIDKNENDLLEVGSEFISQKKLENIIFLGKELTYNLNTKIEQPYFIPARGANEVKFMTKDGWYVLLDTTIDPEISLNFLNLFFEKGFNEKKKKLEYVDARINEKIFYVTKNEKKDDDLKKQGIEEN